MLTGLTDVTDGDASLFGLSIANQMDNVHSIIGVCPQQNVLFDTLTVKEHLYLFAELKGVPKNEIDSRIQKAIEDVGLTEKTNSQSKTLSGGQKRKLCVAIAFIGDPKVVFLDEPTSGMDVSSRRATWDIIKQNKKDKVIVLTTHFLEEADLLGDRVGIMAKGKLVCCGTPLFLKSKYGVGYTITLTKSSAQIDSSPILDKIAKNVATFQLLQDVGTELMIRIPVKESPNFPELFREFDNRRSDLQIVNYGVSVTTLEEVFINVGHDHDSREKELIGEYSQKKEIVSPDEVPVDNIQSLMKKSRRDDQTTNSFSVWLRHFGALFVKRWHFIKRDKGSVVCLSLMPVIMMLLAIAAINSAIRFASKVRPSFFTILQLVF